MERLALVLVLLLVFSEATQRWASGAPRSEQRERSRLQVRLGGNLALLVESVREEAGITFRQQAVNGEDARTGILPVLQLAEVRLVPAINGRIDR